MKVIINEEMIKKQIENIKKAWNNNEKYTIVELRPNKYGFEGKLQDIDTGNIINCDSIGVSGAVLQ